MSSKLLGYVWDACAASNVKGVKLMVMVRLADYSSDEGVSYPSVETIARQIGAGESSIRSAIAELEKDDWLVRKHRRQGNRNSSNLYYLNVERLQEIANDELAKVKAARISKRVSIDFDPPKSDASKSERSEIRGSSDFDPPDSSKVACFDPPESGGDPQVKSKHDLQVNSKQEPQEACAKKKYLPSDLVLPDWLKPEIWHSWVTYRREIGKPIKSRQTVTQAISLLEQCYRQGYAPEIVINRSIANGWQGLFVPKPDDLLNMSKKPSVADSFGDKDYGATELPAWFEG